MTMQTYHKPSLVLCMACAVITTVDPEEIDGLIDGGRLSVLQVGGHSISV